MSCRLLIVSPFLTHNDLTSFSIPPNLDLLSNSTRPSATLFKSQSYVAARSSRYLSTLRWYLSSFPISLLWKRGLD